MNLASSARPRTTLKNFRLPVAAGTFAAITIFAAHHATPAAARQAAPQAASTARVDWSTYGGQPANDHYSPLRQITRTNVAQLKPAWTFDMHETGGIQTNPLIIEGRLFGYSPSQKVIALDAATGKLLWTFAAEKPGLQPVRGFAYFADGSTKILFAAAMSRLYALDPATGRPIETFGEHGFIDLRKGLTDGDYTKGFVAGTTPGVIYKDTIIVGFRAPETHPALHGDIRAFDVHTGAVRWQFHTIPHPGEFGYDTWPKDAWKTAGAANNWCGMALDTARGIVYAPTGSAVDDFYGADRHGDDLFANTLLALDANTGQRLWHFQGVHHDIWDRDFPSPPSLVTVQSGGKNVDAVAQTTKHGVLYLFDRVTGAPLFPIDEKKYPQTDVPGEQSAATQPMPRLPEPFARQRLTADLLTTRTPDAHAWAVEQFKTFRSEGQFVPLTVDKQTVIFPGFDGGAEWGGSAVDPATGVIYINANDVAWSAGLTATKRGGTIGARTYQSQCAGCHGADRAGSPGAFPSLVNIGTRNSDDAIKLVVQNGKGRMPSFPAIDDATLKSLIAYLHTDIEPGTKPLIITSVAEDTARSPAGAALYAKNCASCHGDDLRGRAPIFPRLLGVRGRKSDAEILALFHNGKGAMPAFPQLSATDNADLLRFLGPDLPASDKQEMTSAPDPLDNRPAYSFTGYHKFLDPDGYPAVKPPWGTLNAIDLNTGKYLWKIPLGEYPELAAKGLHDTGSENYGGPILTASGVLFIAATNFDHKIRAFNSANGQLLWQADLPYAGNATPATYMVNGKQYLVIGTSSARDPKGPQGSAWVAFALP